MLKRRSKKENDMKKMTLFILGAICAIQLNAQEYTTAIAYNDYIIEQQNSVGAAIVTFNEVMSLENTNKETIQPYYDVLILSSQEALVNLTKMPDYEGNSELRDAAIDMFKFYERTFRLDYSEMINLVFKENLDEETMNAINALLEKITNEEMPYDERFATAQSNFSITHGFQLIENDLQEDLNEDY